ncbi:MAG: ATP-binding cassette domain-containing protein [Lentimicrobium sp.]|jgi:ABC-type multidrug transport system ATPase subunit|nr:ATP-binding cassette domain-containing protein [Lentimicrobium sp.]
MLTITLEKAGKKYNHNWIFSELTAVLNSDEATVILGANGSGKSTLLQVISSAIMPTRGEIAYQLKGTEIRPEHAFRLMSIAAPYIELIEDFTLTEMVCFHRRLKPLMRNMATPEFIRTCQLTENANKALRHFSSGMKQRVRLALAILSDTPILLLDEPITNLDKTGIEWYRGLIEQNSTNRLIVISSNSIQDEFDFCKNQIKMEDYKKVPHTEQVPIHL